MSARWPHTAAVLAGGASVRMGRPKASMVLADGRSMVETVAGVLGGIAVDVVVLGGADTLPDLRHVVDLRPGHGPLGGIEALLASGLDTQYLVCPCDVPRITAGVLRALLTRSTAAASVLRVEGEDRFRPLPARFSAAALDAVRGALDADQRAVHRVIATLDPEVVPVPSSAADVLTNVNTPADFGEL